jgi:hypothetical protein
MRDKMSYPAFHYSGEQELDLPSSGIMTVRFKKCASSESENSEGKEQYSCTVEVLEILSIEAGGPKKSSSKETDDALDAIAKKNSEEYEEED